MKLTDEDNWELISLAQSEARKALEKLFSVILHKTERQLIEAPVSDEIAIIRLKYELKGAQNALKSIQEHLISLKKDKK